MGAGRQCCWTKISPQVRAVIMSPINMMCLMGLSYNMNVLDYYLQQNKGSALNGSRLTDIGAYELYVL